MVHYSRQIVYLDLTEAGNKVKNAGFLKLEQVGNEIRWLIQIRGLKETDTGFYDLRDETGALVDKILLKQGEGSYFRSFEADGISRGGRAYGQICGACIGLAGRRTVRGTWKMQKPWDREAEIQEALPMTSDTPAPDMSGPEKPGSAPPQDPGTGPEMRAAEAFTQEPPEGKIPGKICPWRKNGPKEEELVKEPVKESVKEPAAEKSDIMQETFYEDKWEQLRHMYPVVHPFGDEREYLSITPGEFVVMTREYQNMVRNSFLLHGYYNYRHVILGKYGSKGQEKYYLGVPGVYYDREKRAAEMFGFEAFEGKDSPAEQGSFGYYMKQVRI